MSKLLLNKRVRATGDSDESKASPIAEAERINKSGVADYKQELNNALAEAEKLRDSFLKTAAEYGQQVSAVRDLMFKASPPYDVSKAMSASERAEFAAVRAKIQLCLDLRKLCEQVEWA